jgi:hypothetical protein
VAVHTPLLAGRRLSVTVGRQPINAACSINDMQYYSGEDNPVQAPIRGAPMTSTPDPVHDERRAKVLLLGTFHFEDAGRDRYKPQHSIDILSEQRQREVTDVVQRLAAFQPTKVALETPAAHQEQLDQDFLAYCQGAFHLTGNEMHQLGFRLAHTLGHNRLYGVDVWGRYYEPALDIEIAARDHSLKDLDALLEPHTPAAIAERYSQKHLVNVWWSRYAERMAHADEGKTHRTLRENLLEANNEQSIISSHGVYLVDWFKVGTGQAYPGVDWVTAWYNRNLRIFANVQRITGSPDERFILIIGAGHLPILRHCVLASPEYDLIEVHDYLADTSEQSA